MYQVCQIIFFSDMESLDFLNLNIETIKKITIMFKIEIMKNTESR